MRYRQLLEGRSGFEIVDPKTIHSIDAPDDYYYHVTTRPGGVVRSGLRPNQRPAMDAGFYRSYSEGKVFFCERPGVPFWLWRIGDHLEAQFDHPPKLGVVRFPKSMAPDPHNDELGSRDSHVGSFYVSHAIAPTIKEALDDKKWQALLARGAKVKREAEMYAKQGKPAKFRDKYGITYLVSKDLNYPPDGWRVTMFGADGQPTGHWEAKNAYEAFREILAGDKERIGPNHLDDI